MIDNKRTSGYLTMWNTKDCEEAAAAKKKFHEVKWKIK